jgi:hypothetical protein
MKINIFLAIDDGCFIGCFWTFDFFTNTAGDKVHSCFFNGAAVRGVSPSKTKEALEIYLGILYNLYGIVKIKACVEINKAGKFRKKNKNCSTRIYVNAATKILEKLRFKYHKKINIVISLLQD